MRARTLTVVKWLFVVSLFVTVLCHFNPQAAGDTRQNSACEGFQNQEQDNWRMFVGPYSQLVEIRRVIEGNNWTHQETVVLRQAIANSGDLGYSTKTCFGVIYTVPPTVW